MGEAKRRKQLDPNWGKPRLIEETFNICKELFSPKSKEGESALRWGVFDFYRTALESSTPGVTMLNCSQGSPGVDTLPGFKGTPVFIGNRFIALDVLPDTAQTLQLPIEGIRHLATETDFSSNRIIVIRFQVGSDCSDSFATVPVAKLEESLTLFQGNPGRNPA